MKSANDNVIISKDELTRKEIMLKDRLYNNSYQPPMSKATLKMLSSKNTNVLADGIRNDSDEIKPRLPPSQVWENVPGTKPTGSEIVYG